MEDLWYNERLGMVMLFTSSLFPRDYSGYALDCSMSKMRNARVQGVHCERVKVKRAILHPRDGENSICWDFLSCNSNKTTQAMPGRRLQSVDVRNYA